MRELFEKIKENIGGWIALFVLLGVWFYAFSDSKETTLENSNVVEESIYDKYPYDGDYDCVDFESHNDAQLFFEAEGSGDPHRLDRDEDGLACELLP